MSLKGVEIEALEAELIRRYRKVAGEERTTRNDKLVEWLEQVIAMRRLGKALVGRWRADLSQEIRTQ